MKKLTQIIHFIIFTLPATLLLSQSVNLESKVDEICAQWTDEKPGGVVGIIQDGELVFSKAYGLASMEYDVPNSTETIFNIASVTKQITAYAIVLLEEQGKLSIDDDIRKYLPEIPDFGTKITIRHLLTHTSGLRNFQNLLGMAGWRQGDPMTNDDLLRYMTMQKELNFPVGEEYLYCNTGFVLATFIVERITGMDFKEWTRKNIFIPLGMINTSYREDMTEVHANTATSYNQQGNSYTRPLEFYNYMGNGNVYTNINDMAKWVTHLGSGHANIDKLTRRGILNNGDTISYALGIGVGTFYDIPRWSHGGSIGGYRSNLQFFPEHNLGIVVLANHNTANPGGKGVEIARHILKTPEPESREESSNRFPSLNQQIDQDITVFRKFTGAYYVQGVVVDVYEREGNRYMIAKGETPEFSVTPASDTSYFNGFAGISVYFADEGQNIVINRGGELLRGKRIEVDKSNYEQYAGSYYSPELEALYKIFVRENTLVGYHSHLGEFGIYPVEKDFIRGSIFQFADIKIIRWPTGEIKGLRVGNGRVRDIWFDKID